MSAAVPYVRAGVRVVAALSLLASLSLLSGCFARAVSDEPLDGDGIVDVLVRLDQSVISDDDGDAVALVDVTALQAPPGARPSVHLAVVLDTSGSMEGRKMDNARQAAHELVDRLDNGDHLTLVSYGDQAQTHVSCLAMRGDRAEAHEAIDELEAAGNTCVSCGLQAGYDAITTCDRSSVERVLVLSDGHANRGITDAYSLSAMVSGARGTHGIETATIGLGRLHDEVRMAALAEAGAADYHFLHNSDYLVAVLDAEIADLHATAVTDVYVVLRPGDGVQFTATPMLGGQWSGGEVSFDLGQMAVGEARELAIEMALPPGDPGRALTAHVAFRDVEGRTYRTEGTARVERSQDPGDIEASIDADVVEAFLELRAAAAVDDAMILIQMQDGSVDDARARLEIEREAMLEYATDVGYPTAGPALNMEEIVEVQPGGLQQDRGEALRVHAQNNDRRRGRPAAREAYAPAAMDMSELE